MTRYVASSGKRITLAKIAPHAGEKSLPFAEPGSLT